MSKYAYMDRIPNRYTFEFGPYRLWVEDDKKALTTDEARAIANAIMDKSGANCTRCTAASRYRLVRSHEPEHALCDNCASPAFNDHISSTRA